MITLNFEDGELSGRAACNYYGSPYTLQGSRIQIGMLEQTAMLCEQPAGVMEQEARYMKALAGAAMQAPAPFRLVDVPGGRRLEITDNMGLALLVFEEKARFNMNPADLSGKAWRLVSLFGSPPEGSPALLYFYNGQAYSGFAGCRHYYGSYQAEGDTIAFPTTFMMGQDCHENAALNEQESRYINGLSTAQNYHIDGGRLDLLADSSDVLSFLAEPDVPPGLEGTSWRLLAFFGPQQDGQIPLRIPEAPLLGAEITLEFDAGRAAGSAGCNTYRAAYSTDGVTIVLEPPSATRKLCAQPEGQMQQEQHYLRMLENSMNYRLLGEQLWLNMGDGQSLLFARKP